MDPRRRADLLGEMWQNVWYQTDAPGRTREHLERLLLIRAERNMDLLPQNDLDKGSSKAAANSAELGGHGSELPELLSAGFLESDRFVPRPQPATVERLGSAASPFVHQVMSNGLIVSTCLMCHKVSASRVPHQLKIAEESHKCPKDASP